jgi:glycosyltransferase involved in cell wall biosynthesis
MNGNVIHHGIDSNTFKPTDIAKNDTILTVANDFVNRDYCLNYNGWKRITSGLNTKLVGDTEGLSKAAESVDELVKEYNSCGVYLNTSTLSPIPTSLLEAMSCGCAVVSTATCMIPEIIQNGYNGYISNNESELRHYTKLILEDESLRKELGNNARKTIIEKFSEQNFVNQWNTLFDKIYEESTR